jgi:hypothetical protein
MKRTGYIIKGPNYTTSRAIDLGKLLQMDEVIIETVFALIDEVT